MQTPVVPASPPHPFNGHAGMRTTRDGSLIVKPAYPSELAFYQALTRDPYLFPMRPFIPKFFGTMSGEDSDEDALDSRPISPGRTESLILENLCNQFSKPNTLDVKLGTKFYDDKTDPVKVLRMEKTSRETTSLKTGVRLTDFQVYDNMAREPVCTPKSYGKALKESELARGLAKFFPVYGESLPPTIGLPQHLLLPILDGIRNSIARIRDTYSKLEMCITGGSLLIMYEGDWNLAEEGLKPPPPLDDLDADCNVRPPPYTVKLVDFAHTRVGPGLGHDAGVLLGLQTMLKLLDGRIAELTADPEVH
ncbi:hypothetical protein H0H92_015997 [Tricholoma furcatifolium]|nr:hypothetical protein H0H92_015997 [Tricholoma furcatifolium]